MLGNNFAWKSMFLWIWFLFTTRINIGIMHIVKIVFDIIFQLASQVEEETFLCIAEWTICKVVVG